MTAVAASPLDAVLATDLSDETDRLILADLLEMEFGVEASGLQNQSEHHRWNTRWMIRRDVDQVMASEAARADGWTEEELLSCLRPRNSIGMVVEHGDVIVGHVVYLLHKDSVEMIRLAVHPDFRGLGVAAALAAKVTSKLAAHRRNMAYVDVPAADLATICALLRCGWQVEGSNETGVRLSVRVQL